MHLRQTTHTGASVLCMKEGKLANLRGFLGKLSRGAVVGAALAASVMMPRGASANSALGNPYVDFDNDDAVTLYEPITLKKKVTIETFGVAGTATVLAMGGAYAVALKKEKKLVLEDIEAFESDMDRMEQFKKEFLDGEVSDRSLFASFDKAVKAKLPEESNKLAPEDEFEKNVQAFLDEENEKANKKNKPEFPLGKGGATLLERPDDIDGSKTDDWLNDIEVDDKPAEIDSEQLKRLQRMFGGGDASSD